MSTTPDAVATADNCGSLFHFVQADTGFVEHFVRHYLSFKDRVRLFALNKALRCWLLRYFRVLCNDMDFGKYLRQRICALPVDGPYAATGSDAIFSSELVAQTHTSTVCGLKDCQVFLETILRPTSDYVFGDQAAAMLDFNLNDVPPMYFKFHNNRAETRYQCVRGLDVDDDDKSFFDHDTPLPTKGVQEWLVGLGLDEDETNSPLLVRLVTPLANVLAMQQRSWITYLARMRRMRNDFDLEAAFDRDPALAIHGVFAFNRVQTITDKATGRLQRILYMDYVARPMAQVVHRVV